MESSDRIYKEYQKIDMPLCLLSLFVLLISQTFVLPSAGISKSLSKPIIVVNPGHGGPDHGARGVDGTLEKHVVLTLANLIIEKLKSGYQPISTRTGDYFISLADRTALANHSRAVLFISIHAEGSFSYQTSGLTIAYLGHDAVPPEGFSKDSPAPPVAWGRIQLDHAGKSIEAGKCIQKELAGNSLLPKTRLASLPLKVLSGANMPALLIEIGYLTNPVEERKLKDIDYLTMLAEEIASGIDAFLSQHEKTATP